MKTLSVNFFAYVDNYIEDVAIYTILLAIMKYSCNKKIAGLGKTFPAKMSSCIIVVLIEK